MSERFEHFDPAANTSRARLAQQRSWTGTNEPSCSHPTLTFPFYYFDCFNFTSMGIFHITLSLFKHCSTSEFIKMQSRVV